MVTNDSNKIKVKPMQFFYDLGAMPVLIMALAIMVCSGKVK